MSADIFCAREQEKCRPPFSGEDSVDVTRGGRAQPQTLRGTPGSLRLDQPAALASDRLYLLSLLSLLFPHP